MMAQKQQKFYEGFSPENKKKVEAMRAKDKEVVKGIFRFYEMPNGQLEFVHRAYPGDPVEKYTMVDGQIYSVPLGVAKHLNKNGWYPEYKHIQDPDGKNMQLATGTNRGQYVAKKIRRFGFQGLDFVDMDDFKPENNISVVTTAGVAL